MPQVDTSVYRVRSQAVVTLKNAGKAAVDTYVHCFASSLEDKVAAIKVRAVGRPEGGGRGLACHRQRPPLLPSSSILAAIAASLRLLPCSLPPHTHTIPTLPPQVTSTADKLGAQLRRKPEGAAPPSITPAAGFACREYALPAPLKAGATLGLTVESVYTHVLSPEPASIRQNEVQYVRYDDSALMASPYTVQKQVTEVRLPPPSR